MDNDVRELFQRMSELQDGNAWPSTIELMNDLADALSASLAREEALRDALRSIDRQVSHAMLGDWSIALNCIRKLTRDALQEQDNEQ